MKVLHVFKDYFPPSRGGIELLINDLVHSMDGFEFEVLTSSRTRRLVEDVDDGVRVVRAPEYARPTSTPITPAWIGAMRRTDADLIHFHMPNPAGELAYLASRTRVPMIATYHADIVGRRGFLPLYLPFQQRALGSARRIVVSSPAMQRAERLRPHMSRITVIPFGIDPGAWSARPAAADEIRARYGSPLVGFLGRLAYYKGVDVLLEAMRDVDGTLLVAGTGPREQELQELARRLDVAGRTVFLGEIDDRMRVAFYHAIDAFVLPSTMRAEAFGISLLEAMACGTPVVSTELGTGTSWVNVNAETGVVVPPGDPSAISGAVGDLLADQGKAAAMGEAGARRVAAHFTKREMLESLGALYLSE
ncbi:MAG TPA: glycosyltransferase [Actinomycetota bacterium]|jgi:rhamnosyl/mannosyltransferase|nr:glycosyltransferase [Actinomycetota bacterium]